MMASEKPWSCFTPLQPKRSKIKSQNFAMKAAKFFEGNGFFEKLWMLILFKK